MKQRKNKNDLLKKIIAWTIAWTMVAGGALQTVNAVSFNIEGLDMQVENNWWSWNWWWTSNWVVNNTNAVTQWTIETKINESVLDKVINWLDLKWWEFYINYDLNWDWKKEFIVIKKNDQWVVWIMYYMKNWSLNNVILFTKKIDKVRKKVISW